MDTHTYKGQLKVNVKGCSRSTTGQWQQQLKVNYRSMSTTAQGQLQVNLNNSSRSTTGQCQQQLKVNCRLRSTSGQSKLHKLIIQYRNKQKQEVQFEGYMENSRNYILISHIHLCTYTYTCFLFNPEFTCVFKQKKMFSCDNQSPSIFVFRSLLFGCT